MWALPESERGAERARRLTRTPHPHTPLKPTPPKRPTGTRHWFVGQRRIPGPQVMRTGRGRMRARVEHGGYKNGHALACCG
jgi:hypothetical protein